MNSTIYVGSHVCKGCGGLIGPIHAMVDKEHCAHCRREIHADHVKNRMAPNGR